MSKEDKGSMNPDLLSSEEASKFLGTNPRGLYKWRERAGVVPMRVHRVKLYSPEIIILIQETRESARSTVQSKNAQAQKPQPSTSRQEVISLIDRFGSFLTGNQFQVLDLRYGVSDEQEKSLNEIARIRGTTDSAVVHLEKRAIKKLRKFEKDFVAKKITSVATNSWNLRQR